MTDPNTTFAEIDATRATIIDLLRSASSGSIAARTPSGDWSPIENCRHLLFAERLHFRRLLGDVPYSRLGLVPDFMAEIPALKDVGTEPTDNLDDVIAAWDEVHEALQRCTDPSAELEEELRGNLSHLRHHLGVIESLLKQPPTVAPRTTRP